MAKTQKLTARGSISHSHRAGHTTTEEVVMTRRTARTYTHAVAYRLRDNNDDFLPWQCENWVGRPDLLPGAIKAVQKMIDWPRRNRHGEPASGGEIMVLTVDTITPPTTPSTTPSSEN